MVYFTHNHSLTPWQAGLAKKRTLMSCCSRNSNSPDDVPVTQPAIFQHQPLTSLIQSVRTTFLSPSQQSSSINHWRHSFNQSGRRSCHPTSNLPASTTDVTHSISPDDVPVTQPAIFQHQPLTSLIHDVPVTQPAIFQYQPLMSLIQSVRTTFLSPNQQSSSINHWCHSFNFHVVTYIFWFISCSLSVVTASISPSLINTTRGYILIQTVATTATFLTLPEHLTERYLPERQLICHQFGKTKR